MAQGINTKTTPLDNPISGPNVGPVQPPSATPQVTAASVPQQNIDVSGAASGTPKGAPGWKGNFHADDLINSQFTGLSDQQRAYIRNQLANQGLTEHSKATDFVKGLQSLANTIPGLSSMSVANQLFPDQSSGAGGWDPLAQQLFLSQVLQPALQNIQQTTQQTTAPYYQQALSDASKAPGGTGLSAMIKAMQGGENELQGSLAASALTTPGLNQLMANVTAARQAAQRAYYEAERNSVYGSSTSGGGLAPLIGGSSVIPTST